jgi:hypothetical protein
MIARLFHWNGAHRRKGCLRNRGSERHRSRCGIGVAREGTTKWSATFLTWNGNREATPAVEILKAWLVETCARET